MFLIGHPLGWWTPTTDPGWKWLWWQYALADTRYVSGNPWIFALEVVGVITGVIVFVMWTRLIKVDLPAESRIRCLWGAFAGCAVLMSSTAVYFLAEVGAGFDDIGQGAFGLWVQVHRREHPVHRAAAAGPVLDPSADRLPDTAGRQAHGSLIAETYISMTGR